MKVYTLVLLLAAVVFVECDHTFMGNSVVRPLVYHKKVQHPAVIFQKKIAYLDITPAFVRGRSIQGILAYDLTHSGASINVTQGGIGHNFVNFRMKSDTSKTLQYDIYIYA